jgi:hypothetical protein
LVTYIADRLTRRAVLIFAGALIYAVALALLQVRTNLTLPSLTDDWYEASRPRFPVSEMLSWFVEIPPQRFRPVYDVLAHLQWHTFDAPELIGPNLWNAVRLAVLVIGAAVIPALIASWARPGLSPLSVLLLACGPAAVFITTPGTAVDFVRFGPVEPGLLGLCIAGAALMAKGLGRLLRDSRRTSGRVLVLSGWLLWAAGVYHKEASLCFALAAPFVYVALDRHWRAARALQGPLWRQRAFWFVAIAAALPLVHVFVVTINVADAGAAIYAAAPPEGPLEWVDRLEQGFRLLWGYQDTYLGTPTWRWVTWGLPILLVGVWAGLRRAPHAEIGILVVAAALLAFQGVPLAPASRYYIPTLGLLVLVTVLLAARLTVRFHLGLALLCLLIAALQIDDARSRVVQWSSTEIENESLVQRVTDLARAGCDVYGAGIRLEQAHAVARVAGMLPDRSSTGCPTEAKAIVFTEIPVAPDGPLSPKILDACARPGFRDYGSTRHWRILACSRLRDGQADQTFEANRFVPGRLFLSITGGGG